MDKLLLPALSLVLSSFGDDVAHVDQRLLAEFNCKGFDDSQNHGLKAVLGPNLETDYCSYMDATETVPKVFATCETFCGEGRIPVPLAVPTYGINHEDMDKVCLGGSSDFESLFGTYDPDLMGRCRKGYTAMEDLKSRAADAVATINVMKVEQLTFRAKMRETMKDIVATVTSEEFTKSLMAAPNREKIIKYQEKLEALLKDVMQSGESKQRLVDAMAKIEASIKQLSVALDEKLPILQTYVETCGRPVLAVSSTKDYLMDVCNQNQALCMDDPDAQHVGCCCGTLPATGLFDIPADPSGRRLATGDSTLGMDVCYEAVKMAKADIDRLKTELKGSDDGSKVLSQFEQTMKSQYPTWSDGCAKRRRLPEVSRGASAPDRQLEDKTILTCSPPATPAVEVNETLKVAFSQFTEKDYCGDLMSPTTGTEMTTVDLADQCTQFCGEEAVPLLVGSIDFGFNQSAIDSVCINSDIVTTDAAKVTQCLEDSEVMHAVDVKVAAFIAALTEVELAKIEYETAVAAQLPAIKAKIEAEAEGVLKAARSDKKAAVYSEFLRTEVFKEVAGNSQQAVKYKSKLDRLGKAVASLQTTAAESIQSYTRFLSDCSDLFTGQGEYKEYMLDQCSQTSTECVESEHGRHSGCCCGYTPFMAVGMEKVSYSNTIPGIAAAAFADEGGLARVGKELRRLSAQPKSYYDICGSVWEGNAEIMDSFRSEIQGLGTEDVFQDWLKAMKSRYPDADLCLFEGSSSSPSPSGGDGEATDGADGMAPHLASLLVSVTLAAATS